MKRQKIGIINLGINNLHSILEACKSLGYKTSLINLNQKKYNFDILILPGVGSFKKAMKIVKSNNIKNKILDHVNNKDKLLIGICLGMQMFFSESDEFGYSRGLNLINGSVKKLDSKKLITPHTGWNSIKILKKNNLINTRNNKNMFYFTHSFYCKPENKKFIIGETNYLNFKFCSIVKKDNIIGIQFHPEKSGLEGLKILDNLKKI